MRPIPSGPFVGRQAELERLRLAVERVGTGKGGTVVVTGEPGIGKTRLMEELLLRITRGRFTIMRATADEVDQHRPFGVITDAIEVGEHAQGERGKVQALLRSDAVRDIRFGVIEAVLSLVEAEALRRPVIMAIEDVHWADASSLLTLRALQRRRTDLPLLLLLTARPVPERRELQALLGEPDVVNEELGPLETAETQSLASELWGGALTGVMLKRLSAAGGNPFFIEQLLYGLADDQGEAQGDPEPPASVRTTVLRRLALFSEAAVETLRVAAVLGETFPVEELVVVTGRSAIELLTLLNDPIRAGYLAAQGDHLRFRHDVVREALYFDIPRPLRRSLHLHAARSLGESAAAPLRVARHFAEGAEPGDGEAISWLDRAAEEAVASDPSVGVELLNKALDLLPANDDRRDRFGVRLILPLAWSGRGADAERVGREVLERTTDPEVASLVCSMLWDVLWSENRMIDAAEVVDAGLAVAGRNDQIAANLLIMRAYVTANTGRLEEGLALADEVLPVAERTGASFALFGVQVMRLVVGTLKARFGDALESARHLVNVTKPMRGVVAGWPAEFLQAHAYMWLAMVLLAADEPEELDRATDSARRLFEGLGAGTYINQCHWTTAARHFIAGEWDDALAESEASRLHAEEAPGYSGRAYLPEPSIWILAARGDLAAARERLSQVEEQLRPERQTIGLNWVPAARAALLEVEGRAADAVVELESALDFHDRFGSVIDLRLWGRTGVRLALDLDRPDVAGRAADAATAAAEASDVASFAAAARHGQGLINQDPDALAEALATYRRGPRVLNAALVAEDLADVLRARGEAAGAVDYLESALGTYGRVGAGRDEGRVRSSLRELGVRTGTAGSRDRPETGWQSLTPSEQRVARLVADGLSNPQIGERLFISRRTVATHVSHAFRKLGISSRVELAAVALQHPEEAASAQPLERSVS